MKGVDISNWAGEVTPAMIADLDAAEIGFVVVRLSLESPAKTALAQRQIAALSKYAVMGYDWCYPVEDDPLATAQASLAAFPNVLMHWPDVEQIYTNYPTLADYAAWLAAFLNALDGGAKNPSGVYSGSWYWTPRLGNGAPYSFTSRPLWAPSTSALFGGWASFTVTQTGTGTFGGATLDTDEADDAFIASLQPQPSPVQPGSALERVKAGRALLAQAEVEFAAADADLES